MSLKRVVILLVFYPLSTLLVYLLFCISYTKQDIHYLLCYGYVWYRIGEGNTNNFHVMLFSLRFTELQFS